MSKTIITSSGGGLRGALRELFHYRELFLLFAYRDLRVKYAQTFLGILWVVLNPLVSLILLTFVFQVVVKVDTHQVPPLIFTIAGLCGWTYFSEVFTTSSESIISAQQMVKKIYFPRLILPLSKAVTALIDLAVVLVLLLVLMLIYQFVPSRNLIFFPLFLALAILSGIAGGLWMSALTIRFRDFRFVGPTLLRIGLFITPVAYPASAVPDKYLWLFYLNPMAGVVEGIRWSLIGGPPPSWYFLFGLGLATILCVSGLLVFQKAERNIADIL